MRVARHALLIVDFQNDFTPEGALPVPQGDRIAEPLNRLLDTSPPAPTSPTARESSRERRNRLVAQVALLVFDGCPKEETARALVERVAAELNVAP